MSNGDSPDGFVFPPFIPPSAARAPHTPPPLPVERAAEPEPVESSADDLGELPWLELPEPRESQPAPAEPVAAAADDAPGGGLPDWMTWDARAEGEAEAELADTAPVEGLEAFDPVAGFGGVAEGTDVFPYGEPELAADVAEEDEVPAAVAEADDAPEFGDLELESGYDFELSSEPASPAGGEEGGQGFAPGAFEDPFAAAPVESAAPEAAPPEPDPFTAAEIEHTELEEPAPEPGAAAAGGAFEEVAARLEEIARALRERPDELLAGPGSDPLALLVTGYVLGWSHARRG